MLETKQILHKDKPGFSPNRPILHFSAQYIMSQTFSKAKPVSFYHRDLSLLKSQKQIISTVEMHHNSV